MIIACERTKAETKLQNQFCGLDTINIQNGQDYYLAPGNYGDIHVYSGGKLHLRAGKYGLKSLTVEPDVQVMADNTNGTIEIDIRDNCSIGDRSIFTLASGTSVSSLRLNTNQTSTLRLGIDARFTGRIVAPQAEVDLNSRKNSDGTPRIRANIKALRIHLDPDVVVNGVQE
jgi:hypothetical protein